MCPSMRAGASCQSCLLQWQQPLAAWRTQRHADRRTAAFHNVQAGGGGGQPHGKKHTHTHYFTRDGTRTHNLLLRREAPYPLGHTSSWLAVYDAGIMQSHTYHISHRSVRGQLCCRADGAGRS